LGDYKNSKKMGGAVEIPQRSRDAGGLVFRGTSTLVSTDRKRGHFEQSEIMSLLDKEGGNFVGRISYGKSKSRGKRRRETPISQKKKGGGEGERDRDPETEI